MKKFLVTRNKDQADTYIKALIEAGYQETRDFSEADFILVDYEHGGALRDKIINFGESGKPIFVYPHVPYGYFLWDGIQKLDHVSCQFVPAIGPKMGLQSIEYPYRVEVVGFHNCPVKPFEPTSDTNLLFAPSHTFKDGRYALPEVEVGIMKARSFIQSNQEYFSSITVRCSVGALYPVPGWSFHFIDPYATKTPALDAIVDIERADIVIATGTLAYLAVALGKPTIMWGYDETPGNRAGYAQNYDLYRHHFEYPLQLERMSIFDVLSSRDSMSQCLERWKWNNIGDPFDPEKFINVIREALS